MKGMIIIKKIILTLIFIIFISTTSFASSYTKNHSILNNDELFEVTGTLPIADTNNLTLNKELDNRVDIIYRSRINNAKKGNITKLHFSYEEITSSNYVSIIIYSNITNLGTTTHADTLTFSKDTMKLVTIDDFSELIPAYQINRAANNISQNINTSFNNSNNFYVEDNKLVLINSAGAGNGLEYTEIPLNLLSTYTLLKKDYYVKNNYQITMIPLRTTLENLGYKVTYTSHTEPIVVTIRDEFYYFNLDDNKYHYNDSFLTLEVNPEIKDNTTYVPISFLSEVLNKYYKINSEESITIGSIQ